MALLLPNFGIRIQFISDVIKSQNILLQIRYYYYHYIRQYFIVSCFVMKKESKS